MKKNVNKLILLLILSTLLSTTISASDTDDRSIKHDFKPSKIIFVYNDHNTTTYQGDTGLIEAYCNNTVDNTTYYMSENVVRGIAYATKKTFNFNENIDITQYTATDGKLKILKMYYKNGTEIQSLSLMDDNLTLEQQKYFDNYQQEKSDYDHKIDQMNSESLQEGQNYLLEKQNSRKYGYYFGPGGPGIIYNP